jgi:hypothetical protein
MRHGRASGPSGRFAERLRYIAKALLLARKLQKRYRLRGPGPIGLVMGRSGLNIVYTSRFMQPCGETFDDRFRFGPCFSLRAEAGDFNWSAVNNPVLIYIS